MQKEEFDKICYTKLEELNINDEKHKARLKWELIEAEVQDLYEYFFKLKGKIIPNENNVLIPYLLGICKEFDINKEPECVVGDSPDIDQDFVPYIRDYIKQEWAPKHYGEKRVANIGSFGTYHVSMALIDMARIFDKERSEVLNVTKNLPAKDDDGKTLDWDSALAISEDMRKYCEKYPDVAEAAQKLCGRNRNIGQHAAGLIIAGCDLDEIVPLMGKDYQLSTAWAEGQATSDLSAVGLVKFDCLSLSTLDHMIDCLQLIKERHNITSICSLPEQSSWSDISYLENPKSLAMANAGDLKMIFQFGSPGIRSLSKKIGVNCFEDLVAITTLYRPGPLQGSVHDMYHRRKHGLETYEIDDILKPILSKNYALMIYQEDIMQVLNVVGKIPLRDCTEIIKAISKKKIEKFAKHKDKFIENGQKVLNKPKEELEKFWQMIEFFAGYGFNRSHAVAYSYITSRQLYLKSHYPIEFYASGLNHIKGEERDEKLKEFKKEVENHQIRMRKPHLNKSKIGFSIQDEEIYYGFSEIKGIGKDIAQRIVENQPYTGIEDFLNKFGSDSKVVQPLIALGVFDETDGVDKVHLYKFYEAWKDKNKKKSDSYKRFQKSIEQYKVKLPELIGELSEDIDLKNDEDVDGLRDKISPETYKALTKLACSYKRTLTKYIEHADYYSKYLVTLNNFNPDNIQLEEEVLEVLNNPEKAEEKFFGFIWTHPLEKCVDKKNFTFEQFKLDDNKVGPVEVLITKSIEKVGKVKFRVLDIEDANWESAQVTVFYADYERFTKELQVGNTVRLRLQAPTAGFHRYTFDNVPPWKKHLIPPRDRDFRAVILS